MTPELEAERAGTTKPLHSPDEFMFLLASPIVDWSAIWKIFLVVLAAGVGTVVIFGFLLLGLKVRRYALHRRRPGQRIAGRRLGSRGPVRSGSVIGIIVLGIYAMTQK